MRHEEERSISAFSLTRRQWLGLTVLAPFVRLDPQISLPSEDVSKEGIEQQFGIRLITLKDWYQEQDIDYPEESSQLKDVPTEWDTGHLALLRAGLNILPPHFRAPDAEGRKLVLILSNTNHCNDTDPSVPPHQVNLDYLRFQSLRRLLEGMAYELTHALMPKTVIFLSNPYIPSLPILKIESPWFPIVDEIFEGSYSEKGTELWYKVSERIRKETQTGKKNFYKDLLTGLKRTEDAYEMISVFSQHHLYGKDFMYAMYGEFFNQAQLDKLYRFTRDDIYGMEYAHFPFN